MAHFQSSDNRHTEERTRMRAAEEARGLLLLVLLTPFAGCGSSQQTISIPSPNAGATPLATSSATTQTTPSAPTNSSYPLVHRKDGPWPFTAQLVSITKSPEGFPGAGSSPPGFDKMMVRVNMASQTSDRTPPTPSDFDVQIECKGTNSSSWNPGGERKNVPIVWGWDEGSNAPDSSGSHIGMGYEEPHTWDAEWEVPEATDTTSVKCTLNKTLALNY
jgi:hypothetical protein